MVGVVDDPPKSVVDITPALESVQLAVVNTDVVSENVTALSEEPASENTVPEKYQGLDRFVARERIVNDMDALNLTIKIEDKKTFKIKS